MSVEKRRFSRIQFQIRVKLTLPDGVFQVNDMVNLGVGGCLLPLRAEVEKETACELEIYLTGSSSVLSISIGGTVVRCERQHLAIRFTRIDPDGLFHLHNIIRYNSDTPEKIEDEIRMHPGLV